METFGKFVGMAVLLGFCAVVLYADYDLFKKENLKKIVAAFDEFVTTYQTIAVYLFSIIASYVYVVYVRYTDARALKNRLEKRFCDAHEKTLFERPDLEKDLLRMLAPSEPRLASDYYLITGEQGVGKTRVIKKIIKKIGGGVIFVDIPLSSTLFARAFAKASGYKHRGGLFAWLNEIYFGDAKRVVDAPWNVGDWDSVYTTFKDTAKWYKAKHHKMPVLVIDNVDMLATNNPKILEMLQLGAESAIEQHQFVTVFVSSNGMGTKQIKDKADYFCGMKTYCIGDINRDQTFEFLQKRGMPNTDGTLYSRVFALIGGRLELLDIVSGGLCGKPFEEVKKDLYSRVSDALNLHWRSNEERKILEAIVKCILERSIYEPHDVWRYLNKDGIDSNIRKIELVADQMGWVPRFYTKVVMSYLEEHPQISTNTPR